MCLVKTPKISTETTKERPPHIFQNDYLGGIGPDARAQKRGRNSLRLDSGSVAPSLTVAAGLGSGSPSRSLPSGPISTGFTGIQVAGASLNRII